MSEEIFIKDEGGQEVAYRRIHSELSPFDVEVRIGELYENSDGSKETRGADYDIRIERPDESHFYTSDERRAVVDGQEGVVREDYDEIIGITKLHEYPTFKPAEPEAPRHDTANTPPGSSPSYDYGSYDGASSAGGGSGGGFTSAETTGSDKACAAGIALTLFFVLGVAISGFISEMSSRSYVSSNTRANIEERRRETPDEKLQKLERVLETVRRNSATVEQKVYAIEHPDSVQRRFDELERKAKARDVNHRQPTQEYEKPAAVDAHDNAADTTRYEMPVQKEEPARRPPAATAEETGSMSAEEAYGAIMPNSDYAKSTPRGYAPVVRETRDADGNASRSVSRMSKDEMEETRTGEIGFTYPRTGRRYTIDRGKYPELYRALDRNGDGQISLYEMSKAQKRFSDITARYPEGDVDSIAREFVRRSKNKFGPFR